MGKFPSNGAAPDYRAALVNVGPMTANAAADVLVTWATPFADANYVLEASVTDNESTGIGGALIRGIRAKNAGDCTVRVVSGATALTNPQLQALGVHL